MFLIKKMSLAVLLLSVFSVNFSLAKDNSIDENYMNSNTMRSSHMMNTSNYFKGIDTKMDRIKKEKDPVKRNTLRKEHLADMQMMMAKMQGMMGKMGHMMDKEFNMCLQK